MNRLGIFVFASITALAGCAPTTYTSRADEGLREHHTDHARSGGSARAVGRAAEGIAGLIDVIADIADLVTPPSEYASEDDDDDRPEVRRDVLYGPPPAPAGALVAPATRPDPAHRTLDPARAFAAVHAIDVSTCSTLSPGTYGHARVTFGDDGRAVSASIEGPQTLSREAIDCVEYRLGRATVLPFDGAPVTVGASFFVGVPR